MPPRRKRDKKKKGKKDKKGNISDSSTPQSSTPSVEDEKQQLFQGGACGSRDSHELGSEDKLGEHGRMSGPQEPSHSRSPVATSPRNASQSGPSSGKDLLTIPNTEGSGNENSPSKKNPSLLKRLGSWSPKKKSSNLSADPNCDCEDKKNHQQKCLKMTLAANSKNKSPESKSTKKSRHQSKSPGNDPSLISKENGKQSSSTSDPSAAESSGKATGSENSLLADQERAKVKRRSTSKGPLSRLKSTSSGSPSHSSDTECGCGNGSEHRSGCPAATKRKTGTIPSPSKGPLSRLKSTSSGSPSHSSDTECSCGNGSKHRSGCPAATKRETGTIPKSRMIKSSKGSRIKSDATSSSGSPGILKDLDSSESPRRSDSKSSSNSGPKPSCTDKGNRASGGESDNKRWQESKRNAKTASGKMEYDPQDGTSRANEIIERGLKSWLKEVGKEPLAKGMVPTIEHEDYDIEEGDQKNLNLVPRRRSKSTKQFCRQRHESATNPQPIPQRGILKKLRIPLRFKDWNWFNRIRGSRNPSPPAQEPDNSKYLKRNPPDKVEKKLLKGTKAARLRATDGRRRSVSPVLPRRCTCPKSEKGSKYFHDIGCSFIIDLHRRRVKRRCSHEYHIQVNPKNDKNPDPKNDKNPGPKNDKNPGPKNDKNPGPKNDKNPGPKNDKNPGPKNDKNPGPKNDKNPGPEYDKNPDPEKDDPPDQVE